MNHVPVEKFGKDHWSTFVYLETRVVDHRGQPARQHLRIDANRHPGLAWRHLYSEDDPNKKKFPTRLVGGEELHDHDDWDCAEDLEAAGLLEIHGTGLNPIIRLTDEGRTVASDLRRHKAAGRNFASYRSPEQQNVQPT